MKKIYNFILSVIFGKEILDGYSNENIDSKDKVKYIYASVFPDRPTMEKVLKIGEAK